MFLNFLIFCLILFHLLSTWLHCAETVSSLEFITEHVEMKTVHSLARHTNLENQPCVFVFYYSFWVQCLSEPHAHVGISLHLKSHPLAVLQRRHSARLD